MKSEKVMKVLVSGILAAGLLTSFGGAAMAGTVSGNGYPVAPNMVLAGNNGTETLAGGNDVIFVNGACNQSILQGALGDLVTAGTINQTQGHAVLAYFQQNTQEPSDAVITVNKSGQGLVATMIDPLKNLVDNGTLTEAQARAVRDKEYLIVDRQWQTNLDTLVSKGNLTQDQAGKIHVFLTADQQKIRNMLDQTADMSAPQRAQYFEKNLAGIMDPVSGMVDQGIITRQQGDVLTQTMPSLPETARLVKLSSQQLQGHLNVLVDQGTISLDQSGKILAFLSAHAQNIGEQVNPQQGVPNLILAKDPVSGMVGQGITGQQAAMVRGALVAFRSSGTVPSDGSRAGGVNCGPVFFFVHSALGGAQS